jgi:superfamily I DNA and/or RNA helicase
VLSKFTDLQQEALSQNKRAFDELSENSRGLLATEITEVSAQFQELSDVLAKSQVRFIEATILEQKNAMGTMVKEDGELLSSTLRSILAQYREVARELATQQAEELQHISALSRETVAKLQEEFSAELAQRSKTLKTDEANKENAWLLKEMEVTLTRSFELMFSKLTSSNEQTVKALMGFTKVVSDASARQSRSIDTLAASYPESMSHAAAAGRGDGMPVRDQSSLETSKGTNSGNPHASKRSRETGHWGRFWRWWL